MEVAGFAVDAAQAQQTLARRAADGRHQGAAFRELVAQLIVPVHRALTALLARHCGLQAPDTDIAQLSFAIIAMANDYCLSRAFMDAIGVQRTVALE